MFRIDTLSSKIFFTSDQHFGHEGILQFATRPFASVTEMDETMIARWNEVVPDDGLVFVLGDIGFAIADDLQAIYNRLNGQKILVRGNHDSNYKPALLNSLFVQVEDLMYVRIQDADDHKFHYMVLCHYPMVDWQSSFRGSWQLFGHLHTRGIPEFQTVRTHLFSTQYDVGVDNNDFRPVSLSQLKYIIQAQSQDPAFLKTIYY